MSRIIDFITGLGYEHIPEKTLHIAKICLLDAVGCMLGGIQYTPILDLARNFSHEYPGNSRIAGTSLTAESAWAAFINTHACTFFDMDDGHRKAQGHPGGVIIPLSLMTAAENNLNGKSLLTAVVAGYETAVRSALIMRENGGPRKGAGAWSILGGTAALGKLAGLSDEALNNALGLAEYYAPQAPQDRSLAYPSSMKEGMPWSSYTALSIIRLAKAGFDGMTPFLADSRFCEDLGQNWEMDRMYFKMYACCRFSHPVLDGVTALMQTHDVSTEDIEKIHVKSFAKAVLLNRTSPENTPAAMYSIPYAVGVLLTKGAVTPDDIRDDAPGKERVLELARKVTIEEDPQLTNLFPEKCLAQISLWMKDGSVLESDVLSAKGDPDNPYSPEEMKQKFMSLARPLSKGKKEALYDMIINMENASPKEVWEMIQIS